MYDFENQLTRYKKRVAYNRKKTQLRKILKDIERANSPIVCPHKNFRNANDNLKTSSRIICLN